MYLGLDLGTSALKALLSDDKGNIIKGTSASYDVKYVENNGTQQDPKTWLEALDKVLLDLKEYLKEVRALAISGQMHGLVILDEKDQVIRPCILWNDGRTTLENEELNQNKEFIYEHTANISYGGFTLPKFKWLAKNEPTNFSKIKKIMLPKDYLIYYLTNIFASDYTDMAGTLLLDVRKRTYSKEMLELVNIKVEQLPKLYESYEVIGLVKEELQLKYGFAKAKVVAGGADNALAAIGTNTLLEGTCNISLGTSGTILMPVKEVPILNSYGVHIFSHIKGSYIMGCILSAANCRKWWLEDILKTDDYALDEEEMKKVLTKDLYFLPYLQGERSPHNDTLAKGAFIGLTTTTTKASMSKAILEGVGFAIRDSLEIVRQSGINITSASLCGGGSRSKLWGQILANILGVEVKTLKNEQGPSFGAIILAMIGDGRLTFDQIDKLVNYDIVYEPKDIEEYNLKYHYYKKLYPALKKVFTEN